MRVLSLFDGMACGYEALVRAGIPIDVYYASEIDKYAIQVAKKNHPDIIEIGDVCQIKGEDYKDIDLIIGGSPCQGFSMAGKMLNFDDPRSKLFFEFVRLVKEIQPKYFLLENVKMKKEFQDVISSYMGVEPIEINSALVSAQNRKRLYWTNIPGITQPQDKGLLLKDVLQDDVDEKYYLSEKMKSFFIANDKKQRERGNGFRFNVSEGEKKASSVTTRAGGRMDDNFIAVRNIKRIGGMYGQNTRWGVYDEEGIAPTITASMGMGGGHVPMIPEECKIRKLTPIECERLQTLNTTKHKYEILFDFDDYEWFIEQTRSYVNVEEKCHKSQNVVGNAEKEDGEGTVLSVEKNLNTNNPQTNKLVQENALTNGEAGKQVKLFLNEQSIYVSDAEGNLRLVHLNKKDDFVLGNVGIDMLFERIAHLGNEGLLEKEGIYITQKNGIIQLRKSGKEMMQLVKDAERDLTTLKKHFTSIILDHSSIENLEQKLAILFYYVLIVIVGYIQEKIQVNNSLEINIEIGYTAGVSDTQRYKMLGNGWTCDVISHIFSFLPKE